LALRAVIFDYGKVLSLPPDPEAHAALVRITGLDAETLDRFYWADRDAYDKGLLTDTAYWNNLGAEAGLTLSEQSIKELVRWDALLWLGVNSSMIAWQLKLKQHGLLTAILSNMTGTVHQAMKRKFDWLGRFDVQVWSYELGTTKPDPAIYNHALEKLDVRAEETLFLDDRAANVEAAVALGMKSILFTDVETLREELRNAEWATELPLP